LSIVRWLQAKVLTEFDGRILPIKLLLARRRAHLHALDRKCDRDALIAATGLVHGMIVVSRNVSDIARTDVNLLNSWGKSEEPPLRSRRVPHHLLSRRRSNG